MMYLDAPPRLIGTEVFSSMPDDYRRKGVRTDWADANRPGQPTDCFIEGPSFDADGNLYIVDIPFGRIFRIAPDGKWSLAAEYDGWRRTDPCRRLHARHHGARRAEGADAAGTDGAQLRILQRLQRSAYRIERRHLFYRPGADRPSRSHGAGLSAFVRRTARLPDRYRNQPQWTGARSHRDRAVCRDDSRQRGLARSRYERRQCLESRPLLFDLRSERSRWSDNGPCGPPVCGARLARTCVRVRAQWRIDCAHQVLRGTKLHQCRHRRQEPR